MPFLNAAAPSDLVIGVRTTALKIGFEIKLYFFLL